MSTLPKKLKSTAPWDVFGARLKSAYEAAGLSRAEVARQTAAGYNTIWRWERGENQPSTSYLVVLRRLLGTRTFVGLFRGIDRADLDEGVRDLIAQAESEVSSRDPLIKGLQREMRKMAREAPASAVKAIERLQTMVTRPSLSSLALLADAQDARGAAFLAEAVLHLDAVRLASEVIALHEAMEESQREGNNAAASEASAQIADLWPKLAAAVKELAKAPG